MRDVWSLGLRISDVIGQLDVRITESYELYSRSVVSTTTYYATFKCHEFAYTNQMHHVCSSVTLEQTCQINLPYK